MLPFPTLPAANSYDTSLYPDLPWGPAIPLWRNSVTKSLIKYWCSYFENRILSWPDCPQSPLAMLHELHKLNFIPHKFTFVVRSVFCSIVSCIKNRSSDIILHRVHRFQILWQLQVTFVAYMHTVLYLTLWSLKFNCITYIIQFLRHREHSVFLLQRPTC